jgi:putative Mg2+ transporter-C (MgtC) family protein
MKDIHTQDMVIRLTLALLAGLLLGADRDIKNKPVDFRAYIITSVTAALVALVSLKLVVVLPIDQPGLGMDPSRIVQAILMGIAFLGAATIIKREDQVIGTATGATVWAAGGIGLTLGFGFYDLALVAFLCIFLTLILPGLFLPDKFGERDSIIKKRSNHIL